jgi:hypothetical protein
MKKLGVILLVMVLCLPNVLSYAVSPGKTIVFFPGDTLYEELSISVRNDKGITNLGEIYVFSKSFPEEYVNFDPINVTFEPYEKKVFDFSVSIPKQFEEPGDYRFDFVTKEIFEDEDGPGATITVKTAVAGVFLVRVPAEGYFLKSKLESRGVISGEPVPFILTLENLGTYPIDNIQGVLEISDESGEVLDEIEFTHDLALYSINNLELFWKSEGANYGNYHARAIMTFQGKEEIAETDFKVGEMHISILEYDKTISSGSINKFKLKIRSDWGNQINNAYAVLDVNSGNIQSFKSSNFNLDPWKESEIIIYVDAQTLGKGEYPAKIGIMYEGIYDGEEFELKVTSFDMLPIIVGGVIFLIVFGFGYLFLVIRKLKKEKK